MERTSRLNTFLKERLNVPNNISIQLTLQVLTVFVGGASYQVARIGGREWGISMAVGFVSMLWDPLHA